MGQNYFDFRDELEAKQEVEKKVEGEATEGETDILRIEQQKIKDLKSYISKTRKLSDKVAEELGIEPEKAFELLQRGTEWNRQKTNLEQAQPRKTQQKTYNLKWVKKQIIREQDKEGQLKRKPGAQPATLQGLTTTEQATQAIENTITRLIEHAKKETGEIVSREEMRQKLSIRPGLTEEQRIKSFYTRKRKAKEKEEAAEQARLKKEQQRQEREAQKAAQAQQPAAEPKPKKQLSIKDIVSNFERKQYHPSIVDGVIASALGKLDRFREQGNIVEYNKLAEKYDIPKLQQQKVATAIPPDYSGLAQIQTEADAALKSIEKLNQSIDVPTQEQLPRKSVEQLAKTYATSVEAVQKAEQILARQSTFNPQREAAYQRLLAKSSQLKSQLETQKSVLSPFFKTGDEETTQELLGPPPKPNQPEIQQLTAGFGTESGDNPLPPLSIEEGGASVSKEKVSLDFS